MNTQTISEYDQQARDFLLTNCMAIKQEKGSKQSPWAKECPSGHHYRVTIYRKDQYRKGAMVPDTEANDNPSGRVSFDFWGSVNDRKNGVDPSAYDVLSCISGDVHCPLTFEDYCSEYGADEDSRKAEATFKRCLAFSKKLQAFFTEGELEELAEIR